MAVNFGYYHDSVARSWVDLNDDDFADEEVYSDTLLFNVKDTIKVGKTFSMQISDQLQDVARECMKKYNCTEKDIYTIKNPVRIGISTTNDGYTIAYSVKVYIQRYLDHINVEEDK